MILKSRKIVERNVQKQFFINESLTICRLCKLISKETDKALIIVFFRSESFGDQGKVSKILAKDKFDLV